MVAVTGAPPIELAVGSVDAEYGLEVVKLGEKCGVDIVRRPRPRLDMDVECRPEDGLVASTNVRESAG